jgi:hypothetical protein
MDQVIIEKRIRSLLKAPQAKIRVKDEFSASFQQ